MLPSNSRTYLDNPRCLLGSVNGHLLDRNQLFQGNPRSDRAALAVLLIGRIQDGCWSRSWDGSLVLNGRRGVGRWIRRWEYHLVGVLQLERICGSTLTSQSRRLVAATDLVLQGLDQRCKDVDLVLEFINLKNVSILL
jgi:hypothetical protein